MVPVYFIDTLATAFGQPISGDEEGREGFPEWFPFMVKGYSVSRLPTFGVKEVMDHRHRILARLCPWIGRLVMEAR